MLAESRISRAVARTTFAFLAIVVLMLYAPVTLPAQNLQGPTTAIVVAFVTDTAGRPLSGADVSVV